MKDKEQSTPKLNKETASKLVQEHLETKHKAYLEESGDSFVLMPEATIEKEYGWVFFFQNKQYLETKDPLDSISGFGPCLYIIEDGSTRELGVYWDHKLVDYDWIFFKKSFDGLSNSYFQ